jgi:hypothetical protein
MSRSICPMTSRDSTGSGYGAFRMEDGGALTVSGRSDPALLGIRAATTRARPKQLYAVV